MEEESPDEEWEEWLELVAAARDAAPIHAACMLGDADALTCCLVRMVLRTVTVACVWSPCFFARDPRPPPREGWLSGFYVPFIARMRLSRLLEKVAAAGSWAAYERAHRARLARVFIPKLQQIPEEVIPTVIEFWAHTGYY